MKISYLNIEDRIKYEMLQLELDGYDISEIKVEWKELEKQKINANAFKEKAEMFYNKLSNIALISQEEIFEPTAWDEIVRACKFTSSEIPKISSDLLEDKILGGWLGRSAGCLLGKPVEKIPRSGIRELLTSNGSWPLSDYISEIGIPHSLRMKYPWNRHNGRESLKENIVCMPEDDDMNYPMLNLYIYEKYGETFSSEDIIQTWLEMLPALSTFTAERVAYINALNGLLPPKTAANGNPYREWIGAQIRADLWGWVSPSQPDRAAEFSWRDARLSHVKNGVYGEIFFAAAIASSFKYNNLFDIFNQALLFIPPKSKFADAINFVLSLPIQRQSWEDTLDAVYKKFGRYHWVHTINNAALNTAAIISSNGDYETAICNVVMGGWDTDSNGATVGSLMGTMLGANKLPQKWIAPLNNRIKTSLKNFDNSSITDLAKRTVKVAKYLNSN